jgi:curved DNA-binding protein CbpA
MTDHFAALGQPRRPWLDPEQVKLEYQRLTFARHPDRPADCAAEGPEFGAVTDAYRVLSNPKLRLQHLLALEKEASDSESSPVSADLADTFMETAALIASVDDLLKKKEQSTTALALSLLKPDIARVTARTESQLKLLQQAYGNALNELKRVDELWEKGPEAIPSARKLADRFAFLDRWIAQLQEKQFALSS